MKLNSSYRIVHRDDEILLCNIKNVDVYKINDVTSYIISQCTNVKTPVELSNLVYSYFKETPGDFSLSDMNQFVQQLIDIGVVDVDQ